MIECDLPKHAAWCAMPPIDSRNAPSSRTILSRCFGAPNIVFDHEEVYFNNALESGWDGLRLAVILVHGPHDLAEYENRNTRGTLSLAALFL